MNPLDRAAVMRRDYFKLKKTNAAAGDLRLQRSLDLRRDRAASIAALDLGVPAELPIAAHAGEIVELLQTRQIVIVAGETGSGKTTQLPKLCMQAGLGAGGTIGHTQPRRIAARTVAQRIAVETGAKLGEQVGFAVRFSDQTDDRTVVKIMTDGLLLAEIQRDRFLDGYDVIIVDEAHERSLNIDFLLGYFKRLTARRSDLKIVVTSATIDIERFSQYFGQAPVVTVAGRTYPVEVRYQDQPDDTHLAVIDALEEICAHPQSRARDVLVFYSGEREIFEAAKLLRSHFAGRLEVLPLYARLSFVEQQRVFSTGGATRRVVLATNVAETSLTVPNIGYVIDPGFARINRYSYRSKLQRLPIEPVSQASANQRKGRCGRIAPGVCYRLYDESDFLAREVFTDPEIRRVNLASVVLQMQAFGLGDISRFPFIDPPDPRAVNDALRLLDELQALAAGKLTQIGKQMARMPVDPRLARMLVEAQAAGCLRELLVICAGLAIQDPRERPIDKAQAADSAQAEFRHEKSDFSSLLTLWDWIEAQRQELTTNRWQTLLRKRFLNVQRVREWRETHRQLKLVCRELGFKENAAAADYRSIHECILAGSLSLIAQYEERGRYVGARNLKLRVFPGSGLAKKTPKWLVAAEIVETSQVYARCVASVEAQWIERQATHLLKRQYSQPQWSLKRGEVIAFESTSLYGLRLVERRPVAFAGIDVGLSRDLFIRDGLVRGAVADPPEFLRANLREVARVHDLEAKGRRRDLLITDDDLYQFYAEQLPGGLCRVADLKQWLKGCSPDQHAALLLTAETLNRQTAVRIDEQDFPNRVVVNDVELELKYRFAPGETDDGITAVVPQGVLHAIGAEPLEWSVPGMLPAVVEHWLRTLPKSKRRGLAPMPEKIVELTDRLTNPRHYRRGRLLTALAQLLAQLYRIRVEAADWDRARLPDHLLVNIAVVDADKKVIAQGRDLAGVKSRLGDSGLTQTALQHTEERGLVAFPAREVPSQNLVRSQASPLMTYPGFVDRGDRVDLEFFTNLRERDIANRAGYARLALLHLGKVGQYFKKELKKHKQLGLYYASLGTAEQLHDEILRNVIWYCYFEDQELPSNREAFADRIHAGRGELADVFASTVRSFTLAMQLRFAIVRSTDKLDSPAYAPSVADVRRVLDWLVPANFLDVTPFVFLALLPRYLEGLQYRVDHLDGRVPKDRTLMSELAPLEDRLRNLASAELYDERRFVSLKFYVEELRLKLFAEARSKQKAPGSPLANAAFKVSIVKVGKALLEEELRVGLA